MPLPPLLNLPSAADYEAHWVANYVNVGPFRTFDNIPVRYSTDTFKHAFYRDSSRYAHDKINFDWDRASRMDWISYVLEDRSVELYRRVVDGKTRRIALVGSERYVVIIQLTQRPTWARFITAYIVDSQSALAKMRSNPKW